MVNKVVTGIRVELPNAAQAAQLETAIGNFTADAYTTLFGLKEGYVFWEILKQTYPTYASSLPWRTLQEAVGDGLYNLNESVNRATGQLAQMIKGLITGSLWLVGWKETATSDLYLLLVNKDKLNKLQALAQPSAALQGLGQWQSVLVRAAFSAAKIIAYGAAAVVTSWLGVKTVDTVTSKLKAADDQRKLELQNQLASQYTRLSAQNPTVANQLMDQFGKMQASAVAQDDKSFIDKLFGSSSSGSSGITWGLGGAVITLLAIMYFSRK